MTIGRVVARPGRPQLYQSTGLVFKREAPAAPSAKMEDVSSTEKGDLAATQPRARLKITRPTHKAERNAIPTDDAPELCTRGRPMPKSVSHKADTSCSRSTQNSRQSATESGSHTCICPLLCVRQSSFRGDDMSGMYLQNAQFLRATDAGATDGMILGTCNV
jgi:hypothetical protein